MLLGKYERKNEGGRRLCLRKKILTGLLVTIVAAGILAGCGSSASKNQPAAKGGASVQPD
jgi:hypothetical protein